MGRRRTNAASVTVDERRFCRAMQSGINTQVNPSDSVGARRHPASRNPAPTYIHGSCLCVRRSDSVYAPLIFTPAIPMAHVGNSGEAEQYGFSLRQIIPDQLFYFGAFLNSDVTQSQCIWGQRTPTLPRRLRGSNWLACDYLRLQPTCFRRPPADLAAP